MRIFAKFFLNLFSQILVIPFAIISRLEEVFLQGKSELLFNMCSQIMAILPGAPGAFLRRAFYTMTLDKCSSHCHIGFGTIISHRCTIIEKHAYIGNYALIGSAHLGEHCLIGSRVSILSGEALHVLDENDMWSPYSAELLSRVTISRNVWIGEGAIISADIGESCMIGAGSVVASSLKPNIMVAGNPARFIKKLNVEPAPK